MSFDGAVAFALAMIAWSALPGPGLALAVSRAIGGGARAGFAVIAGLAIADVLFLGVALLGLFAVAAALGPAFEIVKWSGAAFLIWQGLLLLLRDAPETPPSRAASAVYRDVAMGVLTTLGNPKAILFFGALLPTLVEIEQARFGDFLLLSAIVVGASSLVYGPFVLAAHRGRRLLGSPRSARRVRRASGACLIGSGILIASR